MKKWLLLPLLLLAACDPKPMMLQNPTTQQIVECKADPWAVWDQVAWNEDCARKYESAGYKRLK